MYSRYMGYDISVKCTAFIPNILGFIMFFTLVSLYGRFPAATVSDLYLKKLILIKIFFNLKPTKKLCNKYQNLTVKSQH